MKNVGRFLSLLALLLFFVGCGAPRTMKIVLGAGGSGAPAQVHSRALAADLPGQIFVTPEYIMFYGKGDSITLGTHDSDTVTSLRVEGEGLGPENPEDRLITFSTTGDTTLAISGDLPDRCDELLFAFSGAGAVVYVDQDGNGRDDYPEMWQYSSDLQWTHRAQSFYDERDSEQVPLNDIRYLFFVPRRFFPTAIYFPIHGELIPATNSPTFDQDFPSTNLFTADQLTYLKAFMRKYGDYVITTGGTMGGMYAHIAIIPFDGFSFSPGQAATAVLTLRLDLADLSYSHWVSAGTKGSLYSYHELIPKESNSGWEQEYEIFYDDGSSYVLLTADNFESIDPATPVYMREPYLVDRSLESGPFGFTTEVSLQ